MSRIGKTKDVLSRPRSEVAAEAGDRIRADAQRKQSPEPKPIAQKPKGEGSGKATIHRTSLSFDASKTSFGSALDNFMLEIEKNTQGLGVKGPKATAVLSRFFADNDDELSKLLTNHFKKIRG